MNYTAIVEWSRGEGTADPLGYSRAHQWRFDGGAVVPGSSSPHVVPPPLSDPRAVDPEEAFVAALSSCHMLWFLAIAAKKGFVVSHYVDEAEGVMAAAGVRKLAMTEVTLHPRVSFAGGAPGPDDFETMHHQAHEACYIANSVRTEVRVEPTIR